MEKNAIDWVAGILVIIGAINWGLIGIDQDWNLVTLITGGYNIVAQIIYILVGISGLWMIYTLTKQ